MDEAVAVALFQVGVVVIVYASRTGTKRNLDAMRARGWGLLVSRAGVWRTEGFERIAGDNGAWRDFQAGEDFNEDEYERFLEWVEAQPIIFDWLVLPDIVAGGLRSLTLSLRYMNRCLAIAPMVLIAVQDDMEHEHVAHLLNQRVGIFLGGSTEWKLATMRYWGLLCAQKNCHYHVARSNSAKRTYAAIAAGANSMDGSSGSRFAVTIPNIDNASRHMDLFRFSHQ